MSASREASILRGSASTRASPEDVWRVLADPSRMREWFPGASDVVASNGYPAVGGRLSWRVGRWRFEASVVEADAPRLLRLRVRTPSATSTVTNRIAAEPGGGARTRYEREVEATWSSWLDRVLAKPIVARSVKREAERVARLAELRPLRAAARPPA